MEVAPSLWVARESPFVVNDFWRSTIGSLKAEQLDKARLFLITTATSALPRVGRPRFSPAMPALEPPALYSE